MIESFAEFRRRLRREAEAQQAADAERRRLAAIEAEKKRTKDARRAALHAEFREYWLHQDRAGTDESEIVNFARWCQLTEFTRSTVLDAIRKRPDVRVSGLKY